MKRIEEDGVFVSLLEIRIDIIDSSSGRHKQIRSTILMRKAAGLPKLNSCPSQE
jgi:hypothetical protein